MAGIDLFVTGGIGGVHRGGELTMGAPAEPLLLAPSHNPNRPPDVSADLTELGRTPVAVICAGAKSILDIPRTLEVLETMGVPVIGFGTDTFPAFFTPSSGYAAPLRLNTAAQVASSVFASQRLGLSTGMVVGVPNRESVDEEEIETATRVRGDLACAVATCHFCACPPPPPPSRRLSPRQRSEAFTARRPLHSCCSA